MSPEERSAFPCFHAWISDLQFFLVFFNYNKNLSLTVGRLSAFLFINWFNSNFLWAVQLHYTCSAFTQPVRLGQDVTRSIFKQSEAGWNSEISFKTGCLTKTKEPNRPYCLCIAGRKTDGLMLFPVVLVLSEIQTALSRIWTRVANSVFWNDSHYAKPAT